MDTTASEIQLQCPLLYVWNLIYDRLITQIGGREINSLINDDEEVEYLYKEHWD